MANRNINPAQLRENVTVFVRGNITYSRITRHITGAELEKAVERKKRLNIQYGLPDIQHPEPFITITINNARVVPQGAQMNTEEQYIEQRFYQRQSDPSNNYTIQSKSPYLPWIGEIDKNDSKKVNQIKPEGELANKLDVTLVLRSYKPGGQFANKGWNLDGVISMEPVRYYSGADTASRMAAAGLTYVPLPTGTVPVTDLEPPVASITEEPIPPVEPKIAPAAPAPVAPPVGDPYASNVQATPTQTPPPQAAANEPWVCSVCGTTNTSQFCGGCGSQKPAMTHPYITPNLAGTAQQGGITYDPNELDNQY